MPPLTEIILRSENALRDALSEMVRAIDPELCIVWNTDEPVALKALGEIASEDLD